MRKLSMVLIILFPLINLAQDFNFLLPTDNDNRSNGMGRTSTVSATGSNAIFYNPALITNLKKGQIQFGGRAIYGTITDEAREDFYSQIGGSYDAKLPFHFKFTHGSFAMTHKLKETDVILGFGIGYNTYLDNGSKYEVKTADDSNENIQKLDNSGGLTTISPAVAVNYLGKYSFGFTYNISVASKVKSTSEESDNQSNTPTEREESEADISASPITLGGFAQITPLIAAAIKLSPGFTINVGDVRERKYQDDSLTFKGKTEIADITAPGIFGLGIVLTPDSNFTIVAEYRTRPFSGYKEKADTGDVNWFGEVNNGSYLGAGFEYKTAGPSLRIGIFRESIPIPKSIDDKNPIGSTGFTIGIGSKSRTLQFEIFAETVSWSLEQNDVGDKLKVREFRGGAQFSIPIR